MLQLRSLSQLEQSKRPPLTKTAVAVRVVNEDSFNAALEIIARRPQGAQATRVAVLNLASHKQPGGGWLNGATAQEEALCYRSSLALSLHKGDYPLKKNQAVYTKDVVIIRSAMDDGHKLLDPEGHHPSQLLSSACSASLPSPIRRRRPSAPPGDSSREVFAKPEDRELSKEKMRLALRMAAHNGHTSLVLGALGCGAFKTRRGDRRVLARGPEGAGVLRRLVGRHLLCCFTTRGKEGNFEIFQNTLGGKMV